MNDAVLFGSVDVFDFNEIRNHVLRIPDVIVRMEEAQVIWDQECGSSFSFLHFFSSENMIFFNNLNLKNLTIAVVQLGLYDRYCRRQPAPKFLIGDVANDAPVRVAANIQTLREMITSSRACSLTRPLSPVRIAMDEGLIGQRLPSYRVFKRKSSEEYEALKTERPSRIELIKELAEKEGVRNLVNVGPGSGSLVKDIQKAGPLDIQVADTVDIDPFLSWFWQEVRETSENRVAQ